jgi:hypothetical protein
MGLMQRYYNVMEIFKIFPLWEIKLIQLTLTLMKNIKLDYIKFIHNWS